MESTKLSGELLEQTNKECSNIAFDMKKFIQATANISTSEDWQSLSETYQRRVLTIIRDICEFCPTEFFITHSHIDGLGYGISISKPNPTSWDRTYFYTIELPQHEVEQLMFDVVDMENVIKTRKAEKELERIKREEQLAAIREQAIAKIRDQLSVEEMEALGIDTRPLLNIPGGGTEGLEPPK